MRAASAELKELMETQRPFTYAATITLTDGTEIELSESEMSAQGCRITWSAGSSSFPVGYAISKCLTLGFFNFNDQYLDYDFFGASVEMSTSVQLPQNTETIDLDTYTITEPEEYGTTITIVGYDAMCRADVPYNSQLAFPASLQTIFREVCDIIDLLPMTTNFANNNFVVDEIPTDLSCRQVLGYIAQLAGGNAIVRGNGVYILPYGTYSFSTAQSLHEVISQNISTDDVVITGVTLQSEDGDVSAGNSGYMLTFENPLTKGNETTAANLLAALYVGLTFRPFEQTTMSYPLAEFGDTCTVYRGGEPHGSYITDIEFAFRGVTTLKCVADSPVRNAGKSQQGSATIRELRKLIRQEKTNRETAEADLAQRIASTKGMYQTIEQTQEGSIYYLHDKPELSNSQIIWKMTADAMAVSTNGGQTWNAGLTVDGVLLAKILNTEGVDASWITTGTFEVKDGQETVFSAELDTGRVIISGDKVFIGDISIADMITDMTGALTVSLSNEMQAIPVDHDGSYDTFPQISTTVQVFHEGTDVTDDSIITISEFNVGGSYADHVYTPSFLSSDSGYVTFSARYDTGAQILSASRKFTLYKSYAGEKGDNGSARLYFLDSNADVIKQGTNGAFTPSVITFSAHYRDGNQVERNDYSGLFKVEVTTDGSTWETVESPGTNKSSTTYTPTGDVQAVRCYLYSTAVFDETIYGLGTGDNNTVLIDSDDAWLEARRDGTIIEGGNLLDIQTCPVVKDVSSLTQDGIFDILTNGGQTQGLYLSQGKVYINAAYIATGILKSPSGGTYWRLDTGELRFDPTSAKIGTGNSPETLSNLQTTAHAGADGFSALMTAIENANPGSGTNQQKLNKVFTKVQSTATGLSAITGAFNETSYNSWDAVFDDVEKSSEEVNNLLGARNGKYDDWDTAFSAIKTSRECVRLLTLAKSNAGYGNSITGTDTWKTMFANFEVAYDGVDSIVKARKAKYGEPSGTEQQAWENVFTQIKQTAEDITLRVVKYTELAGKMKDAVTGTGTANRNLQQSIISLTEDSIHLAADQITWDGQNTSMDANGKMTLNNAVVSGNITASSGTIGGFTIDSDSIRSGAKDSTASGAITLSKANFSRTLDGTSRTGLRFAIGSHFGVSNAGVLYAGDANIAGRIEATSGTIGNFTIGSTTIQSGTLASTDDGAVALTNANFTRSIGGTNRSALRLAIGGSFAVNSSGTLYARNANITGTIASSTISGASISGGTIDGTAITGGSLIAQNASGHVRTKASQGEYLFQYQGLNDSYLLEIDFGDDIYFDTSLPSNWFNTRWNTLGGLYVSSYNYYGGYYKPVSQYKPADAGVVSEQEPFITLTSASGLVLSAGSSNQIMLSGSRADIDATNTYAKTIRANQLILSGSKSRIVGTDNYGDKLLYCYEMPSPMFGDIGEGQIGEDGKCYVPIDPTFTETIQTTQYQVFLQNYGDGTTYVSERKPGYFIVSGTPGLNFGWEIKAKQKGYENRRLDSDRIDTTVSVDYGTLAQRHIYSIQAERTVA